MPGRIKSILNLFRAEHSGDLRGSLYDIAELGLLLPGLHRTRLHGIVGLLTAEAFVNQLGQDAAGERHSEGTVHVAFHILREHSQVLHDVAEAVQHIVQQHGRIRQDNPLHGGMRDVALMPQRHVLVGRHHVAANHARQAGDVLAADRIAFVRHRRRALLAFGKSFFHLADFALLQGTDFGSELVQRRSH
ncbi:hypothetical protein D3C75_982200 [compost metagenome]